MWWDKERRGEFLFLGWSEMKRDEIRFLEIRWDRVGWAETRCRKVWADKGVHEKKGRGECPNMSKWNSLLQSQYIYLHFTTRRTTGFAAHNAPMIWSYLVIVFAIPIPSWNLTLRYCKSPNINTHLIIGNNIDIEVKLQCFLFILTSYKWWWPSSKIATTPQLLLRLGPN